MTSHSLNPEQSALLALVEKLEKAEAGSRQLDLEISVAIDFKHVFLPYYEGEFYRWGAGGDEIEFCSKSGKRIGLLDPAQFVPRWTESIDATLTLLPDNRNAVLKIYEPGEHVAFCLPKVPGPSHTWTRAATPALALITAILKARAQ